MEKKGLAYRFMLVGISASLHTITISPLKLNLSFIRFFLYLGDIRQDSIVRLTYKMWKLALLCMGCSLFVQHIDALEAVVFVKASYTKGMIEAIKKVNGVAKVYYTKPLFLFTGDEKGNEVKDEWNYVVLGKGEIMRR